MADVVVRSTSRQRFNMWLMTIFGASALLLAAIGIYGLMAYSVEQRTQEIGIRLSLGADGGAVRRMMVMQGMRLAIVGVVVGLAASWGLAQFMRAFLFEVEARDPLVFVGVPVLLTRGRVLRGVAAGAARQQGRSRGSVALRMKIKSVLGLIAARS